MITADQASRIREEAHQLVADAAKQALAGRRPEPSSVTEHVYVMPVVPAEAEDKDDGKGEVVPFGEAIRRTLHEQMARDAGFTRTELTPAIVWLDRLIVAHHQ